MADCVDAAVDPTQASVLLPVLDRARANPGLRQLAPSDDSVLVLGEFTDDDVDFSPYDGVKCDGVGNHPRARAGLG